VSVAEHQVFRCFSAPRWCPIPWRCSPFANVVFKPVKIDPPDPLAMFRSWRPQNRNPALAPFLSLCRSLFDQSSRK
jgi:hypothetical protein